MSRTGNERTTRGPLAASLRAVRWWLADVAGAWNRFWFLPQQPHVLALVRIATGLMLLYSQAVLALRLGDFLGPDAWINNDTIAALHGGQFGSADAARSYLWHLHSPAVLGLHHGLTMLASACLAVGLLTRITAPLAWFLQLMLVHRLTGTLFGLDQMTTMLAMYLMLAPVGSVWSLDAWIRNRRDAPEGAGHGRRRDASHRRWDWLLPTAKASAAVTVATRLAQLHVCVIYMFGGLWKARGTTWWDGTAMWFSAANLEYQSVDLTWIGNYPLLFSALTHLTIFWEVYYCALVWPRLTRPLVLAMAVAVHGGIALHLGMITFGTIMIVANAVFLSPPWVAGLIERRQEKPVAVTQLAADSSNRRLRMRTKRR